MRRPLPLHIALLGLALLSLTAAARPPAVTPSPAGEMRHFWFLVALCECNGGETCVVASDVFLDPGVRPSREVEAEFRAAIESRFWGLAVPDRLEPVGYEWRDEAEAELEARLRGWAGLGWPVYRVRVEDVPVREGSPAELAWAGSQAAALVQGDRAFEAGDLGAAILWYERLLELAPRAPEGVARLQRTRRALRLQVDSVGGGVPDPVRVPRP